MPKSSFDVRSEIWSKKPSNNKINNCIKSKFGKYSASIIRPVKISHSGVARCRDAFRNLHCLKSVQIRKSGPNAGKYGPEKTPYLDTFQAVLLNFLLSYKAFLTK